MIIGVDGCRSGWLGVIWDGGTVASAAVYPAFADILKLEARFIGVDMPIGFPERAETGGRLADRLARKRLGARQSSVFGVPCRAAVMASDYPSACQANLAASDPPRKIAKQTFHIFPKMRELDALLTPQIQTRLCEVHPELAFTLMNGERPLDLPKKIKGRPSPDGMALRMSLLEKAGFPIGKLSRPPKGGWGEDDLLDACACAWSALRLAEGKGLRLPPTPVFDARGLRMEICG